MNDDGQYIVSNDNYNQLAVWDRLSGETVLSLKLDTIARDFDISGDGRLISGLDIDGVKVWDRKTGHLLFATEKSYSGRYYEHCKMSADGRFIVATTLGGNVGVWDIQSGKPCFNKEFNLPSSFRCCSINSDGSYVLFATDDNHLRILNGQTGEEVGILKGHTEIINDCSISHDGRVVVTASNDGLVKVWDCHSDEEKFSFAGHNGRVTDCSVSGDGRVVVSTSIFGLMKVWDAENGDEFLSLSGAIIKGVSASAISQDGRVIATTIKAATHIWTIQHSEKPNYTIQNAGVALTSCAASSNHHLIVAGSDEGKRQIVSASSDNTF